MNDQSNTNSDPPPIAQSQAQWLIHATAATQTGFGLGFSAEQHVDLGDRLKQFETCRTSFDAGITSGRSRRRARSRPSRRATSEQRTSATIDHGNTRQRRIPQLRLSRFELRLMHLREVPI